MAKRGPRGLGYEYRVYMPSERSEMNHWLMHELDPCGIPADKHEFGGRGVGVLWRGICPAGIGPRVYWLRPWVQLFAPPPAPMDKRENQEPPCQSDCPQEMVLIQACRNHGLKNPIIHTGVRGFEPHVDLVSFPLGKMFMKGRLWFRLPGDRDAWLSRNGHKEAYAAWMKDYLGIDVKQEAWYLGDDAPEILDRDPDWCKRLHWSDKK